MVIAATFSEKETLFREQAFPQGLESSAEIELPEPGDVYKLANETAVVEKLVAGLITDYAEAQGLFHEGQFGARHQRSAMDAVACLIAEIEHAWGEGKLGACLFMDIKGAFDYVVWSKLRGGLRGTGMDGDLVRWVASFMSNRRAMLVIDGHISEEVPISSGLPQGSPVSPILFVLYVRLLAAAIESAVPEVRGLSFMDDQGLVTAASSIREACKTLQHAAKVAIEWGLRTAFNLTLARQRQPSLQGSVRAYSGAILGEQE
ncbi:hypothetical protein EYB26_000010 [Talaromyces marneffei]|uniref:uncharacterized protein n=1 Tax=Talaromyces marneffei TaxID=37727 RepID=UPI0012A86B1B|nr:uncharacterized protein EYB26_000010 [Talaromyces marneffei]QGA12366.1 hypothetical protein EYB26_000010 [Talaromyces marneffei]